MSDEIKILNRSDYLAVRDQVDFELLADAPWIIPELIFHKLRQRGRKDVSFRATVQALTVLANEPFPIIHSDLRIRCPHCDSMGAEGLHRVPKNNQAGILENEYCCRYCDYCWLPRQHDLVLHFCPDEEHRAELKKKRALHRPGS